MKLTIHWFHLPVKFIDSCKKRSPLSSINQWAYIWTAQIYKLMLWSHVQSNDTVLQHPRVFWAWVKYSCTSSNKKKKTMPAKACGYHLSCKSCKTQTGKIGYTFNKTTETPLYISMVGFGVTLCSLNLEAKLHTLWFLNGNRLNPLDTKQKHGKSCELEAVCLHAGIPVYSLSLQPEFIAGFTHGSCII